ncbi:hypothetical protein O181_037742 [Austropuccinia psidii MF-1]|uniref:Reverse transcriptase domain-containing protein n=1 Tax=Austropuccinia psidii MF-1 TaxID=1389203 RepID=A0A9Q3HB81_9BASI|nr:hypothetical protein [Austropuccinia psidii MF-1]
MTSIWTIIKEIIIPQSKGNTRLNPQFVVVEDAHIQGFLLGTDYQRMYGIDIYNSKNRNITIGTNKEKKFLLEIYQISTHDHIEELMNEFRESKFSTTLTKLSGKIRDHDIELYLDVERPYPPILRRPPYPASMEARNQIEKHINVLLDVDFIRKIGHNEVVEITTPVRITWNDGKSRLCGDFRALNNYTKADRIIFHMGIYEYTRMPFGIKNAPAHFQRMLDKISKEEILEGWMLVYIDDITIYSETWEDHVKYIDRVPSKCTPINLKISLKKCNFGQQELLELGHKASGLSLVVHQNKVAAVLLTPVPKNIKEMQSFLGERRDVYERIKHELTNAPVLILPDFELPFKLYIDAECRQGLGEALHQRQILGGEPREGVICYISRQLKDSEARYGATHTEFLCLVWALEKLHYYFEGSVFEVYTDCTALKSLLNMKTTNRLMLRSQIAIQEYRGNMTIIYKEDKRHTNAQGLRRCPLDNVKSNPAYYPEVAAKIPIHFMGIDRKKNFRFSEWAPESGTSDSGETEPEGTEATILGISSPEFHNEFFSAVMNTYAKHK